MVASCWFFVRDLYYDARIHEHQTNLTLGLEEMLAQETLKRHQPWY